MKTRAIPLAILALLAPVPARAQQVRDDGFTVSVADPRLAAGAGPRICQDEGHHNFHTLSGRFAAFGRLLQADGYRPIPFGEPLTAKTLAGCDVLVIANAQPSDAEWDAYPYPTPSAFTGAEIATIRAWVKRGGGLLLIADHMPLAGAAARLAARFGFRFNDGFAVAAVSPETGAPLPTKGPDLFRRETGSLRDHPITDGRFGGPPITQVGSFTGQAFQADPGAAPLMVLPEGFISLNPRTAWVFRPDTPRMPVGGWLQGAVREVGKGRVAAFGEAAMFTAQIASNGDKMGLNAPGAEQNARFARNVVAWLTEPAASRTKTTQVESATGAKGNGQ